jgi:hypothetical protein
LYSFRGGGEPELSLWATLGFLDEHVHARSCRSYTNSGLFFWATVESIYGNVYAGCCHSYTCTDACLFIRPALGFIHGHVPNCFYLTCTNTDVPGGTVLGYFNGCWNVHAHHGYSFSDSDLSSRTNLGFFNGYWNVYAYGCQSYACTNTSLFRWPTLGSNYDYVYAERYSGPHANLPSRTILGYFNGFRYVYANSSTYNV